MKQFAHAVLKHVKIVTSSLRQYLVIRVLSLQSTWMSLQPSKIVQRLQDAGSLLDDNRRPILTVASDRDIKIFQNNILARTFYRDLRIMNQGSMYSAGKAMHSSLIYDAFQIPSRDQFYVVESHDQATNQASQLSYYYAILLKESYCRISY